MEDGLNGKASEDGIEIVWLGQVPLYEFAVKNRCAMAIDQVVKSDDRIARSAESSDQMRADIARATSHQHAWSGC